MKRIAFVAIGLAVLAASVGLALAAPGSTAFKASFCHRTTAQKRAYVRFTVHSRAAFRHALESSQTIYPVPPGGCPAVGLSPSEGGTLLTATLSGSNEVPTGDRDGKGTATFRMYRGGGQICFQVTVEKIKLPATAAHIHRGAAGVAGKVVAPLPAAPGSDGKVIGCFGSTRPLVRALLAHPRGYYANVHTSDFPGGAVRGQLSR